MKKLLSIVLALVLVLGSLPAFAMAVPSTNPYDVKVTSGENLLHYGFIEGADGNVKPELKLDRQQLAVLLAQLNGEKDAAAAFQAETDYKDAATFADWAKNYIAYATSKNWMVGDAGLFVPTGDVSAEQLAVVLMRILGIQEAEWGKNVEQFATLTGISITNAQALTRGEAFDAIWPAVSKPLMADGKTLGVEIGKLEEIAPVVTELKINSVSATNLKEVVVEFNQPVAKESVVVDNFALSDSKKVESVSLSADGTVATVVVKTPELADQKEYTLTAAGLVSAADETVKLAKTEVKFGVVDKERPEILSVEFTGPRNITVTFSEPIKTAGAVKAKSEKITYTASSTTTGLGTNKLVVPFYSNFTEGTEYTFEITGFQDFNQFSNLNKLVALTFAKDTTAPTAEITTAEQEYVIVEFSKPVKGVSANNFYHSFSSYAPVKLTSDSEGATAVTSSATVQKVYVWFNVAGNTASKPLPEGTVKFTVLGKNSTEIKDLWGNKLADAEYTLTVSADKTAPEVVSVKAKTKNTFEVKFSKEVKLAASNIGVLKEDGSKFDAQVLGLNKTVGKTFIVTTNKDYEGKTVIVNITGAKDTTLSTNKMVDYSSSVDFKDMTAPTLEKVEYVAGEAVYVFFSEDVDSSTALVKSNYKLLHTDGTLKYFKNAPVFHSGNNIVKIPLSDTESVDTVNQKMIVENVTDLAGNKLVTAQSTVTTTYDTTIKPSVEAKKATGFRTIEIVFSSPIVEIDASKFVFEHLTATDVASTSINGKTVTFTFSKDINGADTTIDEEVTVQAGAVKNALGGTNDASTAADPIDHIVPELKSIAAGADGAIVMTFNKDLSAADRGDFVIVDANGNNVPAAKMALTGSNKVWSFAKHDVNSDQAFTISTQSVVQGTGTAKVMIKPFASKIVTADAVKPAIQSVVLKNKEGGTSGTIEVGDQIIITLTEEVINTTTTTSAHSFTDGVLKLHTTNQTFTFGTPGTNAGTVVVDGKVITITITTQTSACSGNLTPATHADVTDAAGNQMDTTAATPTGSF